MSDGSTTHFGWTLPQVNGSINTWGTKLNNNLSQLDSTLWSISGGISQGLYAPSSSATSLTLTNPVVSFNSIAYTASGQNTIMPAMNASISPQVGSLIRIYNAGSYGFRILSQDATTPIFGTGVAGGSISSGGSAYTNGIYTDVPLTGGSGTGARATITVAGAVVSSVWFTARGKNYAVSDNLSASASNIGGTGSGFTFQVSSLTNLPSGASLILTPTSNSTSNGTFNTAVQGDVFSQNNLADLANYNTALNTILPAQSGFANFALLTNGTNTYWGAAVPTGMVAMFPVNAAPTGYNELNGSLLSRTSYPALWAFAQASGNIVADGSWDYGMFSTGDGSTTFRIPDFRGYSPRGWDDSRGVDVGRTIGSSQADAIASHSVSVSAYDSGHNHPTLSDNGNSGSNPQSGFRQWSYNGQYTGTGYANIIASGSYTGASETRVKNIAIMFCIKT